MPIRAPLKILLIEDEDDFRNLIAVILEESGYRVLACANGADAIAAFEGGMHDAAVIDVNLPDMDGVDICRRFRTSPRGAGMVIVMCTVRSAFEPVMNGLTAGADDYVVKPFEVDDLLRRLEKALTRRGKR
jgi:DNA-binding response OmpR family regulator